MSYVPNPLSRLNTLADLLVFGDEGPAWSPWLFDQPQFQPRRINNIEVLANGRGDNAAVVPKSTNFKEVVPPSPAVSRLIEDSESALNLDAVDVIYHSGRCVCPGCSGAARTPSSGRTSARRTSRGTRESLDNGQRSSCRTVTAPDFSMGSADGLGWC